MGAAGALRNAAVSGVATVQEAPVPRLPRVPLSAPDLARQVAETAINLSGLPKAADPKPGESRNEGVATMPQTSSTSVAPTENRDVSMGAAGALRNAAVSGVATVQEAPVPRLPRVPLSAPDLAHQVAETAINLSGLPKAADPKPGESRNEGVATAQKAQNPKPGESKDDLINDPRFANLKKYMDAHPELKLDQSSTSALQNSVNVAVDSMKNEESKARWLGIFPDNDKIALTTAARAEMIQYLSERNAQVAAENARVAMSGADAADQIKQGVDFSVIPVSVEKREATLGRQDNKGQSRAASGGAGTPQVAGATSSIAEKGRASPDDTPSDGGSLSATGDDLGRRAKAGVISSVTDGVANGMKGVADEIHKAVKGAGNTLIKAGTSTDGKHRPESDVDPATVVNLMKKPARGEGR